HTPPAPLFPYTTLFRSVRLCDRYRSRRGPARPERGYGPLYLGQEGRAGVAARMAARRLSGVADDDAAELGEAQSHPDRLSGGDRSEEHTSELQSRENLV